MNYHTIFMLCMSLFMLTCDASIPSFDKDKAFDYIVKQCDFGSRIPNSDAHRQCRDYLYDKLKEYTEVVRLQPFIFYDQARDDTLYLDNIIASFNVDKPNRILLGAHWDCRPWADMDPDSSLHNEPVMGANDAASGVAVLLTLAEIFKHRPPPMGIDIVFFDGEDYGDYEINDNWLLGSKYFAANLGKYRPRYVVVIDMIGDADLDIHKDLNSNTYCGRLVSSIWQAAALAETEHFYPDVKHSIYDDHVPFIEVGIQAAVVIDLDYEWWHTTNDKPEKCSAESLDEVGRTLIRLLYDKQLQ
jgi:glutaminyl-peptide cyclotransferase